MLLRRPDCFKLYNKGAAEYIIKRWGVGREEGGWTGGWGGGAGIGWDGPRLAFSVWTCFCCTQASSTRTSLAPALLCCRCVAQLGPDGMTRQMSEAERSGLFDMVTDMASRGLRCIALTHKELMLNATGRYGGTGSWWCRGGGS